MDLKNDTCNSARPFRLNVARQFEIIISTRFMQLGKTNSRNHSTSCKTTQLADSISPNNIVEPTSAWFAAMCTFTNTDFCLQKLQAPISNALRHNTETPTSQVINDALVVRSDGNAAIAAEIFPLFGSPHRVCLK